MSNDIRETLNARQKTHGTFAQHSDVAQRLKAVMQTAPNAGQLSNVQREALEMIQHKIARMLCGDTMYLDNVRDILGYAQLMLDDMLLKEGATDAQTRRIKQVDGEWVLA